MDLTQRNNVHVSGKGQTTLIFSHGFGCDQSMWRYLLPNFVDRCRIVTYDLVGAGNSDLAAYDPSKYDSLLGYADDLNELIDAFGGEQTIIVGHSVSAMIGALADQRRPGRISGHVMVGASPCYVDSDGYTGGFSRDDIHALLDTLDSNYLGWSSTMAPVVMGAPGQPALGEELTNSFCRTNAEIARQFARVIFLSDVRQDIEGLATPVLILQSSDDLIAPVSVGQYLHQVLPDSVLCLIPNIGHYPHMSAPSACSAAMDTFLAAWLDDHVQR